VVDLQENPVRCAIYGLEQIATRSLVGHLRDT
jgi:hypothetical protein